ncbi:MAG: 2-methylcitrate dehydratase family protein [Hyphomicrobiales bacterium]|nr:2-methylcitrate dehydratase family protein [Hyphomicrobiales bacterium]
MSLIGDLAEFVTQANAAELPGLDRDILRRHAMDTAIARALGGQTAEGRHLRQVFGPGSVAENMGGIAGLVRMTEMDDIHTGSNTTPSSVVVPVAFGLYAEGARDPRELENAIYVGVEILVRFGKAMDGARALFKGFWPTRCAATLAACATACRTLGLGRDQTERALSLAIMTGAGRSGRFVQEPSGRWIVFADAVATGVRMALAARAGFHSVDTPPDGEWIGVTLGLEFTSALLLDDLGAGSVFPELSLKPYATARQVLGLTEAMRALVREGLDPSTIQKAILRVPTSHKGMISQTLNPSARGTAFVSAGAQVATAALAPDDLYDVERRNVLADPRFAALAARVDVVGDPELDRDFPSVWAAEVEIVADGNTLRKTVRHALGSPENRMNDEDLLHKARKALAWFEQEARADTILHAGHDMFARDDAAMSMAGLFIDG